MTAPEAAAPNAATTIRLLLIGCSLAALALPPRAVAQQESGAARTTPAPARDGQHDFDFEIGTWSTRVKRLVGPLTGSTKWVEYEGTTVVRKVWNGRANLVELDVRGPAGKLELLSLRLYDPEARRWSLHVASVDGGTLGPPTVGGFENGRGEFYSREELNGRAILVRFVISEVTPDACRFEQAFSADGGRSWEVNWIAVDTRVKGAAR